MTAIALETLNITTAAEPEALDKAVKELFTYKPWGKDEIAKGEPVRDALIAAYKAIIVNVPSSPMRIRALNCITDARMLANQAISFDGKV